MYGAAVGIRKKPMQFRAKQAQAAPFDADVMRRNGTGSAGFPPAPMHATADGRVASGRGWPGGGQHWPRHGRPDPGGLVVAGP